MMQDKNANAQGISLGRDNPFVIGAEKLMAENPEGSRNAFISRVDWIWGDDPRNYPTDEEPAFADLYLNVIINFSR